METCDDTFHFICAAWHQNFMEIIDRSKTQVAIYADESRHLAHYKTYQTAVISSSAVQTPRVMFVTLVVP